MRGLVRRCAVEGARREEREVVAVRAAPARRARTADRAIPTAARDFDPRSRDRCSTPSPDNTTRPSRRAAPTRRVPRRRLPRRCVWSRRSHGADGGERNEEREQIDQVARTVGVATPPHAVSGIQRELRERRDPAPDQDAAARDLHFTRAASDSSATSTIGLKITRPRLGENSRPSAFWNGVRDSDPSTPCNSGAAIRGVPPRRADVRTSVHVQPHRRCAADREWHERKQALQRQRPRSRRVIRQSARTATTGATCGRAHPASRVRSSRATTRQSRPSAPSGKTAPARVRPAPIRAATASARQRPDVRAEAESQARRRPTPHRTRSAAP